MGGNKWSEWKEEEIRVFVFCRDLLIFCIEERYKESRGEVQARDAKLRIWAFTVGQKGSSGNLRNIDWNHFYHRTWKGSLSLPSTPSQNGREYNSQHFSLETVGFVSPKFLSSKID